MKKIVNKYGDDLTGLTFAIWGLAFKPNIDDLRESPAKYIAQRVMQDAQDEEYYIVEPNIVDHQVFKITNYKEAIEKAPAIVHVDGTSRVQSVNESTNKKFYNLIMFLKLIEILIKKFIVWQETMAIQVITSPRESI